MRTLASSNRTLDEWVLLSRPEDLATGISVDFQRSKFVRSNYREIEYPELEDVVYERIKDSPVEHKLGYHAHITRAGRVAVILREDSDWATFLATNLDHHFFISRLIEIYNNENGKGYSLREANTHEDFWRWASRYVDGTLAQAGVLETPSGIAVAKRSEAVAHYPGYWHTFGSFLPGDGEPLHREGLNDSRGRPLASQQVFHVEEGSLQLHSKVNLYHEAGIRPDEAEWKMVGFVYEFPNHTEEFIYHIKSPVEVSKLDWQHRHEETRFLNGLKEIVDFLSSEKRIVPAGQFSIVAAAINNYPDGKQALLEAGVIRETEIADNYLNKPQAPSNNGALPNRHGPE